MDNATNRLWGMRLARLAAIVVPAKRGIESTGYGTGVAAKRSVSTIWAPKGSDGASGATGYDRALTP